MVSVNVILPWITLITDHIAMVSFKALSFYHYKNILILKIDRYCDKGNCFHGSCKQNFCFCDKGFFGMNCKDKKERFDLLTVVISKDKLSLCLKF